ncbi:MAG: glycosyltransferase family 2 protein [Zoogloeaceae bacterium]|jgi:glycosyltransferase involved in cell wall biosynthesis|nr:glycosyltransferase family 2 protein [Zoogloeaceae bacterium]
MEKMEAPSFSVIIPSHHRPRLLERALQSVLAQRPDIPRQIIVVADVSNPESEAVCQRLLAPSDLYIRRAGAPGPSASRNLGLDLATGRYILFLDDDDAWQEDFLAQLVAHEEIRLGRFVYVNPSSVVENRSEAEPRFISERVLDYVGKLDEEIYIRNQIALPCFVFPRETIGTARFDVYMRAYEDWDFALQVLAHARTWPCHLPIQGVRVFEVRDDSTDRRGQSAAADGPMGTMDYLYVYHRHPAPNDKLRTIRSLMLRHMAQKLAIAAEVL